MQQGTRPNLKQQLSINSILREYGVCPQACGCLKDQSVPSIQVIRGRSGAQTCPYILRALGSMQGRGIKSGHISLANSTAGRGQQMPVFWSQLVEVCPTFGQGEARCFCQYLCWQSIFRASAPGSGLSGFLLISAETHFPVRPPAEATWRPWLHNAASAEAWQDVPRREVEHFGISQGVKLQDVQVF